MSVVDRPDVAGGTDDVAEADQPRPVVRTALVRPRPGHGPPDVDRYDRRTTHGSTLSLITHAGVLAALDPESSWERFQVALESDVGGVQGGTPKEGL